MTGKLAICKKQIYADKKWYSVWEHNNKKKKLN
jgi:hypothetical protein